VPTVAFTGRLRLSGQRSQPFVVFADTARASGVADVAGRNAVWVDDVDCRNLSCARSFTPEADQQEVAFPREEPSAPHVAQA
jgi:hypothetical protein